MCLARDVRPAADETLARPDLASLSLGLATIGDLHVSTRGQMSLPEDPPGQAAIHPLTRI
jgi:hypothetical protein